MNIVDRNSIKHIKLKPGDFIQTYNKYGYFSTVEIIRCDYFKCMMSCKKDNCDREIIEVACKAEADGPGYLILHYSLRYCRTRYRKVER